MVAEAAISARIEPSGWTRWAAWGTVAAVAPSAAWRVLVGLRAATDFRTR
ncbi:hypothetical protein [Nocardia lijiangensis]